MKFGKVTHPEIIDFTLPKTHVDVARILAKNEEETLSVYVGCAKWNKQELK